ncbi:MAG: hypothetical protein O7E51_06505 [Acidobacteria bacterium]|nr:hypothetical protein [Acidobacteriota bacterium]
MDSQTDSQRETFHCKTSNCNAPELPDGCFWNPAGRFTVLFRAHLFLLALILMAAPSFADVIVLKDGRRIVALSTSEQGGKEGGQEAGKISYEVLAGSITIPQSLVARIEKGEIAPRKPALVSSAGVSSEGTSDENPIQELSRQLQTRHADVASIIQNDAVDEKRLRELARWASQGDQERQAAVDAYLTAASFEAQQERIGPASRWAEQALRLSRRDINALLLSAQFDIARQQYSEAIEHLRLAQSIEPDSPDVLTLLGYAYYYADGAGKASRHWKRAYAMRPDGNLRGLIQQTEREELVESGYRQAHSGNFLFQWDGSEVSASFSREILATLERQYWELEVALDFAPREPIVVILYAAEQFRNITQAPGALNDGKIRVPVQGLSSVTGDLARVLKHELAHSFVHRLALGRCPAWLNEGLALMESGERLPQSGPWLAGLYSQSRNIPLAQLEKSFTQFKSSLAVVSYASSESAVSRYGPGLTRLYSQSRRVPLTQLGGPSLATIGYAESQAAVEMIRDQYGAYQLSRLLKVLGEGKTMPEALEAILRMDYAELDAELGSYLTRRYRH